MPARVRPVEFLQYYVAAAILVWLSFAVTVVTVFTARDHDRMTALQTRNQDLNQISKQYIDRIFSNLEALAELSATAYLGHRGDPEALMQALGLVNRREEISLQLSIVGLDGIFIASNLSPKSGADLRDREHIKVHLQAPGTRLFVSKPLIGRVSNKPSINVTRLLFDMQGEPAAIAVMSIDPSKLHKLFDMIALGDDGIVSLFLRDGTLLARSAGPQELIGKTFGNAKLFAERQHSLSNSGQYISTSVVDGHERFYSYNVLDHDSMVVVTGTSLNEFHRDRVVTWSVVAGGLLILAVSFAVGGFLLASFLKKRSELEVARFQEMEARHARELIDAAFEAVGVLIVCFDDKYRLRFANKTATALIKNDCPEDASPVQWLIGHNVSTGTRKGAQEVTRVKLSSGMLRAINWAIAPADWLGPNCLIAIGFDRTELEQNEHAIYQKARLTMIGEMSTSLAHEMAQPLSVINLASTLLRNPNVPEDGKEQARDRLMLAAERVKRTVDRMKIFARKGQVDVTETFVVKDAIESTVALTMTDLKFAGIALKTDLNFSDVIARGSNILLEQVLLNLIINARDAVLGCEREGGGIIEVRAARRSPGELAIIVSDNGPGIPEEIRPRLFEPFFTTKEGGTGLGLALAHGIIRDMGGSIVILEPEVGAAIEIRLPIRRLALDLAS